MKKIDGKKEKEKIVPKARIPIGPSTSWHKDKSDYNRKQKHKKKIDYERM